VKIPKVRINCQAQGSSSSASTGKEQTAAGSTGRNSG